MQTSLRAVVALLAAVLTVPCVADPINYATAIPESCAMPVYPREALRYEQQGAVVLSFLIGVDGTLKESKVSKSSGFPLLDLAAQHSFEKCSFRAGRREGQAIEAWARMQYVWKLAGKVDNLAERINAMRASAGRGDAVGQYQLGSQYALRESALYDPVQAEGWLRKAADQGHLEAQNALGLALRGLYGGPKNTEEAGAWFRKAAEKGHANAQVMYGGMLLRGDGMLKNESEAMQWLRKAAAQGLPRAMTELGAHLMRSDASAQSVQEGLAFLTQAAVQHDRSAIGALGNAYASGRGVARDPAKAAEYYKQAAAMGDVPAQLALADMHERGDGVPVDAARAEQLRDAAAQPDKPGAPWN